MTTQIEPPLCSEAELPEPGPFDADHLAQIAKALGHPARIRIVRQFEQGEPHFAQEIVGECDLAQSTVSEHLRILREAGVLYTIKDGPRVWYCLRRTLLRAYVRAVEDLLWGTPAIH
jgi:ArsR family transcriptional regulator